MKTREIGIVLLALLLAAMAMVPMVSAEETENANELLSDPYYSEAVNIISQKNGIPADQLYPLNDGIATYPLTNKKLYASKVLDKKNSGTYSVYLDDNYQVADPRSYSEKESLEYTMRYGKFEPELSERMKTAKNDEIIPVWIWLTNPSEAKPLPYGDYSKEEMNNLLQSQRAIYSDNSKNIIDFLTQKGIKTKYASQYSPSLFAEVPVDTLKELSARPEIADIYQEREHELQLYYTARTVKADTVWNQGITGSGVNVAVLENGAIAFANPYLTDGSYYNSSGPAGDHATAIAGIIASTDATNKGIAYSASLISANSNSLYESDTISACEWAITNNADVISISWGSESDLYLQRMDMYFDHIVEYHHKTVTTAAGNSAAAGGTGQIISPALGYNMITVGAINDVDSSNWGDDTMASYSSYKNPHSTYEDREKPEVVAPGGEYGSSTMVSTMISSPWISDRGAGTSYAAPVVAGEAALMMQQQSALKSWPETVKAIIMASAIHNIQGESRLSDRDGAGAVDSSKAIATITNGRYQSDTLVYANFPQSHTVYLQSGQNVRAVASWDAHPPNAHPPTTDPLSADLDLVVFGPGGNFVTNSNSWDNNYEIVEFTASTTGNYNIRLDRSRFDGSSERVGFAYCIY